MMLGFYSSIHHRYNRLHGSEPSNSSAIAAVMAARPIMSCVKNTSPETPTVTVNVFNERHLISPYIYGGNFPNTETDFIEKTDSAVALGR